MANPSMRPETSPFVSRSWRWLAVRVVVAIVLAAAGWWWLTSLEAANDPVRVTGFFAGTVTDVDASGTNICVAPDAGGAKRCGVVYQTPGSQRLQNSDHV